MDKSINYGFDVTELLLIACFIFLKLFGNVAF